MNAQNLNTRPITSVLANGRAASSHATTAQISAAEAERYITKVEVAQRLGKTVRCIDNWMKRGLIPFYKIGRSVCFKWSDVDAHLSQTCRVSQRTYAAAAYQVGGSSPIANRK